jgi:hypothetical protein
LLQAPGAAKSKSGIKTPQPEIELIERRLKAAEADYKLWQQENDNEESEQG